jgi:hypothetical protein
MKPYVIQAIENGRWKNMEKYKNRKEASLAYDDYTRFYNRVRVKKGSKVLHTFQYKKKPYFIPEPYGLPFEMQPRGKFAPLPSQRRKLRKIILGR